MARFLLTDDETIHQINKEQRDIDRATDVLSFPMFQFTPGQFPEDVQEDIDPQTGLLPLGDMAISLERARDQAKRFGNSLRRETGYLTIHSILHLLGYDHMDEGEMKRQMRTREEIIAGHIALGDDVRLYVNGDHKIGFEKMVQPKNAVFPAVTE